MALIEHKVGATSSRRQSRPRMVQEAWNMFATGRSVAAKSLIVFATLAGLNYVWGFDTAAEPSPIVFGVVVDPDGKPVDGADVVCGAQERQFKPLTVRTKADGKFRFELPPLKKDRSWVITYGGKAGFAPGKYGHDVLSSHDKGKEVRLVLEKPGAISGTVKDKQGKPIAGARVQYGNVARQPNSFSYGYPSTPIFEGTPVEAFFVSRTDSDGHFRFATIPADLELIFRVIAAGYADLDVAPDWAMAMNFAKPGDAPVALVLETAARIRGRVISKVPSVGVAGLPIAVQGCGVRPLWKEAKTDAEGRFSITGLGSWDVNVFVSPIPSDAIWTARAVEITPRPGHEIEAVIEIIEGVVVEGTVVTADGQRPAPGVGVGMYGPARPERGAAILSATTDEKGRYRFRLPPGETRFYIYGETRDFKRLPNDASNQRVTIPIDAKVFSVPPIEVQKSDR